MTLRVKTSNSSVQIQIKPKRQFEFVQRDTTISEFLDVVDCRGVVMSVETVRVKKTQCKDTRSSEDVFNIETRLDMSCL